MVQTTHLLLRIQFEIRRQILRETQRRVRPRYDGHLHQRIRVLQQPPGEGVARLVERHHLALLLGDHVGRLGRAGDHTLHGVLKVVARHHFLGHSGGVQSGFVADVCDVGTCVCM